MQLDLTSFLRSLNWDLHQKPLSIQGNGVLLSLSARRNFHKVVANNATGMPTLNIARDVEEFLPITVPLRVRATGHPKFAIWHLDQGTAGRKSFS